MALQDTIREVITSGTYGSPDDCIGRDEAAGNVADALEAAGDVGELVSELVEAAPVLRWIAENVDIPRIVGHYHVDHPQRFRALLRQVERLERMVDAEVEA